MNTFAAANIALVTALGCYGAAAKSFGLSAAGLAIMAALAERNGQKISDLAKSVGYTVTSFTPALDKLEKGGWIERRPHPTDRRARLVYLTARAEGERNKLRKAAREAESKLNGALMHRGVILTEPVPF